MSAHVVAKTHIDYLVSAALYGPQRHHPHWFGYFWNPETSSTFDPRHDPDALGRLLWRENMRSVIYRYPDHAEHGLPAPSGFDPTEVDGYTFEDRRWVNRPSTVAILKANDGLEYQSCEHPGWRDSAAHAFCSSLRKRLIATLPGYDEADTWTLY